MKSFYRSKGKYNDNRQKILIQFEEGGKTKTITLPKPEVLIRILRETRGTGTPKPYLQEEKQDT